MGYFETFINKYKNESTSRKNVTSDTAPHLGGNRFHGSPCGPCPEILDYLIDKFAVNSVLDIGAGRGFISHYIFKKYGVPVIAIDGLVQNCIHSKYPIIQHDITKESFICEVDFVHCVEVVEHIEEIYIENLLNTMANGNYILMTHGLPGSAGYHHVNNQTSEYWVNALERKGYELLIPETETIRRIAPNNIEGMRRFTTSGLVFGRKQ